MIDRRDTKKKEFSNKQILKNYVNDIRERFVARHSKYRDLNKPYVLFLLSKANHWFSNFADPELLKREAIVEKVYRSLPKGYDLILKSHPQVKKEVSIEKTIRIGINLIA